jgi:D-threonine aldolase
MNSAKNWFYAENVDDFDSPALLVYPSRVKENIRLILESIKPANLRPHVKTNKIAEVCRLMADAGISKFKSATIAESEMLALAEAPDVLLAYQPTIPKIKRLVKLIRKYPGTKFSCLVDHSDIAQAISQQFQKSNLDASVYIDLNVGMNRTGILPEQAMGLFKLLISLPAIHVLGLHAYDGHLKDPDFARRTENCHRAFAPVVILKQEMEKFAGHVMTLVAGGSPTCFIHGVAGDRECSPGTFVFWDMGNKKQLPEQPFEWAAILICRIISMPGLDTICVDLGHKSVAAENPQPRIFFLNEPEAIPIAQSEEHLVLKVPDAGKFRIGEVFYGVPWHICPSVALYEKALVVENNRITASWKVIARDRQISV